jgi:hypothetical protein
VLSVVIVNYLAYDPLADCLESLKHSSFHPPTSSSSITRRSRSRSTASRRDSRR